MPKKKKEFIHYTPSDESDRFTFCNLSIGTVGVIWTETKEETTCEKCRKAIIQQLKEDANRAHKNIRILSHKWYGNPKRRLKNRQDRFEVLEFTEE